MADERPDRIENLPASSDAEEPVAAEQSRSRLQTMLGGLLMPALALFSALVVGAIIIVVTDADLVGLYFSDPLKALGDSWSSVYNSYSALITGSIGDPVKIVQALFTFNWDEIRPTLNPISESLVSATPLIFTGLAVALAFRVGLFNIGGEGQFLVGAALAAMVGFSLAGLPWFIHMPLAVLAGFVGGAIWGFIPGILKARTGAHEVIVTIMTNYIAANLIGWSLKTTFVQREGRSDPISKTVQDSAFLAPLVNGLRVHWGIVIAIVIAIAVSWFLFRSTKGFEFRAVGLNPSAARYAGISIAWSTVLSMVISGGLAGLGGAAVMLGQSHTLTPGFSGGYGFTGIAVALIGFNRPGGVVAAAILFGALRAGSTPMQAATGTPIDIVTVIQSLVIVFIAAPALVRAIYRIKAPRGVGAEVFAKGWGS
jgi:general nucleoside transport system permease protein